jgi:hypothetical protein
MTCPRCKKSFDCEQASFVDWLFCQPIDMLQVRYINENYNSPLCNECTRIFIESFYTSGINPLFLPKLKGKI